MNTLQFPNFRNHWFLFIAPLVVVVDLSVALTQRGDALRVVEAGLLFDFAILLPLLCFWCYRAQGKRAAIRAVALACLGIWGASHLVPASDQVLLSYVSPLRYVGLAVLIAIEILVVVAVWKAVFKGGSAEDVAKSLPASHDMPPWVAKLLAWEARFWKTCWNSIRRLLGQ
ncbi:MAG: hypothetical protein JNM76_08445 [Betaproteobacteria bacterium]|nr:hypothetical protein [Betaproteobacteria bacterium]